MLFSQQSGGIVGKTNMVKLFVSKQCEELNQVKLDAWQHDNFVDEQGQSSESIMVIPINMWENMLNGSKNTLLHIVFYKHSL